MYTHRQQRKRAVMKSVKPDMNNIRRLPRNPSRTRQFGIVRPVSSKSVLSELPATGSDTTPQKRSPTICFAKRMLLVPSAKRQMYRWQGRTSHAMVGIIGLGPDISYSRAPEVGSCTRKWVRALPFLNSFRRSPTRGSAHRGVL